MQFEHIKEADWQNFLSPFQAIDLVSKAGLSDKEQIVNWIRARAANHEVIAAAKEVCGISRRNFETSTYVILPFEVWFQHLRHADWKNDFWVSGDYQIFEKRYNTEQEMTGYISEVRFWGKSITETLEKYGIAQTTRAHEDIVPHPKTARRGAKRKDWWDQLWLEVIRRIMDDSLKPDSQADLQRWLEDYTMNDLEQDVGDSTLKPMASNLFKFLENNRGKIGGNLSSEDEK